MSYITDITDIFRTYSSILEEGIPSVLSMINKGKNSSLITIQNDKSVTFTKSMGDKVIDCIEHQAELESLFNTVNKVLGSIDSASRTLLTEFYCAHKSLSEALKASGYSNSKALDYARGLFAYHHPVIKFSESEFNNLCSQLSDSVDQAIKDEIKIRSSYSDFSSSVLNNPKNYSDLANSLEALDADNSNASYLAECPAGNVKFWRRRNQLILSMFYKLNPDSDFSVILDLLKEGQGQKRYMQRLYNALHPEQF